MTAFDYKVGDFYVTDDDTTLVHQYYTRPTSDLISVENNDNSINMEQRQPTAVANTSKIKPGETELTISNAFVLLKHTTLDYDVSLFIRKMVMSIDDTFTSETFDNGHQSFKIRIRGKDNEGISVRSWMVYTKTDQVETDEPTISTTMKNDSFKNNTKYTLRADRTTFYLKSGDSDTEAYQLTMKELIVIQDGLHDEPKDLQEDS